MGRRVVGDGATGIVGNARKVFVRETEKKQIPRAHSALGMTLTGLVGDRRALQIGREPRTRQPGNASRFGSILARYGGQKGRNVTEFGVFWRVFSGLHKFDNRTQMGGKK